MIIRKAKKDDKGEFLKIQKEAFPNLDSKKQSKYFDIKIKNNEIFTIFAKEYAGHICFGKYLLNPPFAPGIFIEEFAIKREYRSKGCGTLLIKYLIKFCKNNKISMIYLGTEDSKKNENISYYKKLGFRVIGNLKEINPKSEYKHGQIFMGLVVK